MKILYLVVSSSFFFSCNNRKHEPELFTAKIFLENFDSSNLVADIKFLKEFPFVSDVKFISKDEAKKEYLSDTDNKDWSAVLDENPLPDSYNVMIDAEKFSGNDAEKFKSEVQNKIKNVSDVGLPGVYLKRK